MCELRSCLPTLDGPLGPSDGSVHSAILLEYLNRASLRGIGDQWQLDKRRQSHTSRRGGARGKGRGGPWILFAGPGDIGGETTLGGATDGVGGGGAGSVLQVEGVPWGAMDLVWSRGLWSAEVFTSHRGPGPAPQGLSCVQ